MEVRHRLRFHGAALGMLAGLLGVAPGLMPRAAAAARGTAQRDDVIWAQRVQLDVEGGTVDDLLYQVRQELMLHMRPNNGLEREPLSVFAADCSLADLQSALADLFHFKFALMPNFESFLLVLSEDPAARRAALLAPPASTRKQAGRSLKPSPSQPACAISDPELLKPVSIPSDMTPISANLPCLPAVQRRLAKVAGIRIFSDYAERTQQSLGKQSTDAFFRSLDGMPLHAALDKIAARFDFTWRKSRGWYLFRSRTWQAERRAREAAKSDVAGESGGGLGGRVRF